jgi:hypothetical protein
MDTDIHLKLESGLSARVDRGSKGAGCGLILRFQFSALQIDSQLLDSP